MKPKLSAEQKAQMKACFRLMDADGSGSVDASELSSAFKVNSILFRGCLRRIVVSHMLGGPAELATGLLGP